MRFDNRFATAYLSAISASAKRGILLKGGAILEAVARASGVAFDKTGTLTTGELEVVSIQVFGNMNEREALQMAASLEQGAKHPLGQAIIQSAKKAKVDLCPPEKVQVLPGYGVEGEVNGREAYSATWIKFYLL